MSINSLVGVVIGTVLVFLFGLVYQLLLASNAPRLARQTSDTSAAAGEVPSALVFFGSTSIISLSAFFETISCMGTDYTTPLECSDLLPVNSMVVLTLTMLCALEFALIKSELVPGTKLITLDLTHREILAAEAIGLNALIVTFNYSAKGHLGYYEKDENGDPTAHKSWHRIQTGVSVLLWLVAAICARSSLENSENGRKLAALFEK